MRRATSSARARFLPNTAADSPYSVSFASWTASSTDFTRVIETCGPNDSSRNNCISGVTRSTTMPFITVPSLSPPVSTRAPFATASDTSRCMRSTAGLPTSDPMTTSPLFGSPDGNAATRCASFPANSSATVSSTMTRSVDMQIWPALANAPKTVASTAASTSASPSTTSGALPPSSSRIGLRCFAAICASIVPTRVEPVKFTRRTAGCEISASAIASASFGSWVTTLTTPSPMPASLSTVPINRCDAGQTSDAFRMTVLPHASGIATARTPRMIAAFHGAIPSTTPAG